MIKKRKNDNGATGEDTATCRRKDKTYETQQRGLMQVAV